MHFNDPDPFNATLSLQHRQTNQLIFARGRHTGESRCPEWCADTGSLPSPERRVTSCCFGNHLSRNV